MFILDRGAIYDHDRVTLVNDVLPIDEYLDQLEDAINICYDDPENYKGASVVQHGRVIALRATDTDRLSSAFKAALYLGKYDDMDNRDRFLNKMVKAGHSYEPIRGENILFLYIGVGKPNYDHLVTYTVGRPTRIAGGQRANLPWGYEVPAEAKDEVIDGYMKLGVDQVKNVINLTRQSDEMVNKQQIQVARSLLPVGYVMPPFLMEFTEEALAKTVFRQRLWEKGAQGATVDIVNDMWECCKKLDPQKWEMLLDYHGPHIAAWEKAMRTLRDKEMSLGEFIGMCANKKLIPYGDPIDVPPIPDTEVELSGKVPPLQLTEVKLYDLLMQTVGKLPPSMWEKKQ